MADPSDSKDFARPRVEAAGLHWPTYERQIQQESSWEHFSAPGVVKSSPTGSMGLGQLNSKFFPESDWRDPHTNLAKSIEVMAGHLAKFGSYRKALAAYNWGPANVGGYTKNGQVHPAWDGTRAWRCPVGLAQCATAQRDHYLDVILGPDWAEPTEAPMPPSATIFEDFRDPQPAGTFAAQPKGIILHGSRSGAAGNPKEKEFLGTARFEVNNTAGLGWNATIGEGKVAIHLTPREFGFNAFQASKVYLAVEIAQATRDEPITDRQVDALADWIKLHVLPVWPDLPMHFPTHAEVERSGETVQTSGKDDVFPFGDPRADELRARLMARLGDTSMPDPAPDSRDETINGLRIAVAHLADVVVPKAAAAPPQRDEALAEAKAIREQFVGPRA